MSLTNNRGFSLLEVMLVASLLGGLGLVVTSLTKQSTKSSVKYQYDSEINLITNEINGILSDPAKCLITFATTTPTNIKGKYYISTDPLAPANGYGNGGVKIDSYVYNPPVAPLEAFLTIKFQNKAILKGATGAATVDRKVNLYVEQLAGAITKCRSLTTASTDIWSHGTGADIFYSVGNVGIGVSAPTVSLDVAGAFKAAGMIESTTGGVKFPNGTTQTSAVIAKNCVVGQYISGIDPVTGIVSCSVVPKVAQTCLTGQYVSGIDATGAITCSSLPIVAPVVTNCSGYWGGCSVTCGGGTQSYVMTTPAANGGSACPTTQSCNTQACYVAPVAPTCTSFAGQIQPSTFVRGTVQTGTQCWGPTPPSDVHGCFPKKYCLATCTESYQRCTETICRTPSGTITSDTYSNCVPASNPAACVGTPMYNAWFCQ